MAKTGGGGVRKATVSKPKPMGKRYTQPRQIMGGTVVGGGAAAATRVRSVAQAAGSVISQLGPAGLVPAMKASRSELSRGGIIKPTGPKTKRKGFKKKRPTL
jgi:hypothetical protein